MRLGIAIEETWDFLHEIHADLTAHHDVTLFRRRQVGLPVFNARLNRALFRRDLGAFLRANDVVFFEWASELLAAASHLPKKTGIVTRLHRYEMYRWADRVNWDAVDRIILVTEAKRREFVRHFPVQASKVVVIPEAVSLQRFQPAQKTFSGDIGILCHLRPRKRVYELILAFHRLNQLRPGFHLHIGGGEAPGFGEYYEAMRALVRKLKLDNDVTFYGHVDKPEEWYANIDIFISNGYSEGLQVSLLEAIASGCYSLSHFWDGADELMPADTLYFGEAELVERILCYADMPEAERERRRQALRQVVASRNDVDKTKREIRELIEAVASSRK
ncbi:MAG: glycosyltransferase family 4 protein [Chloroflexi bacterium]|nr:glycosyltransferase family 4 protein [Chloroflexota bacterium]